MKIAVFTDSYRPYVSGVVRSIDTFSAELLALGHQVYIFAPRYYSAADPGAAALQPGGTGIRLFRFWSIPVPTYRGFAVPVPISPTLDHVLKALGIDIVHTHSPFMMGVLGAWAARRRRVPLVFSHHTMYHEYVHYVPLAGAVLKGLTLRYLGLYCRRADLVVAPTPQIATFVTTTYRLRKPAVAIPTGVNPELYRDRDSGWLKTAYQIPPEDRLLVYVGRLGLEKNVELLLRSLPGILAAEPRARLVLVGEGPDRPRLLRLAAQLGIADRLTFTGALSKERVIDSFRASELFFFASTTETQGLATLEAMAAGLPVVAVDAPGTRDLVDDGVEGYLTPADAAALAGRVVHLLAHPSQRVKMSRRAARRAAGLSSRATTLRLLEAYNDMLRTAPFRRPIDPSEPLVERAADG